MPRCKFCSCYCLVVVLYLLVLSQSSMATTTGSYGKNPIWGMVKPFTTGFGCKSVSKEAHETQYMSSKDARRIVRHNITCNSNSQCLSSTNCLPNWLIWPSHFWKFRCNWNPNTVWVGHHSVQEPLSFMVWFPCCLCVACFGSFFTYISSVFIGRKWESEGGSCCCCAGISYAVWVYKFLSESQRCHVLSGWLRR